MYSIDSPRLLIVSDGTGKGTKLIDTKTGEPPGDLLLVKSIEFPTVDVGEPIPTVKLEVFAQIQLNTRTPRAPQPPEPVPFNKPG
jgi:hypothetical protein